MQQKHAQMHTRRGNPRTSALFIPFPNGITTSTDLADNVLCNTITVLPKLLLYFVYSRFFSPTSGDKSQVKSPMTEVTVKV